MGERKFSARRPQTEYTEDEFIEEAVEPAVGEMLPWDNPNLNDRIPKNILIRSGEVFHAKVSWAAKVSGKSLNQFILDTLHEGFERALKKTQV